MARDSGTGKFRSSCLSMHSTLWVEKLLTYVLFFIQITEVQVQVTENTAALKESAGVLSETRRKYQALDIEVQSALSLVSTIVLVCVDSRFKTLY